MRGVFLRSGANGAFALPQVQADAHDDGGAMQCLPTSLSTEPPTLNIATITVPLVPPSANHYVKHTRTGRHYVSAEAHSYLSAVGLFSRNQRIRGKAYKVELWVYLGKRQKLDLDNASKCALDGLVKAGVIDTDAKIVNLHLYKRRDNAKPRTEIVVEVLEP